MYLFSVLHSISVSGITQYICYRYQRFDILFDDLVFSVYFVVYIIRFKIGHILFIFI